MRILITRSSGLDARLDAQLAAAGHSAIAAPMLQVAACGHEALSAEGVQAVLVTSANGAKHGLPRLAGAALRDLQILCVGNRTAAAARESGARHVDSAQGDAAALAALAVRRFAPAAGDLLHLCGDRVAPALRRDLEAASFCYRACQVYVAHPATSLPQEVVRAIVGGDIDRVLLYSPRGARRFRALLSEVAGADAPAGLHAAALSDAVAEAAGPGYASMAVAAEPNEAALLVAAGLASGAATDRG